VRPDGPAASPGRLISMTSVFDPVTFMHGPAMPNRFMLAPLTNQQSHDDGTLSDAERNWLTLRSHGGFGQTMTAAAHVQEIGRAFPGQLGICRDDQIPALAAMADEIRSTGSLAIVQLHHGGNRVPAELNGMTPVCPSDDHETGARALSSAEVEQLRDDFIAAAVRADRAGYDGVELHGAHGYIICQFLSSEINHRTDQYGGSLENRARLLFEIIDGVRRECRPDFHLSVRLSPERFGMVLDEIIEVYGRLVDTGAVDFIDMSLWDVFKQPNEEAHQGRTLAEIFAEIPRGDVRLGVAGKIHDPSDAQAMLDLGIDIIILGRVAILHHDYPNLLRSDAGFVPRRVPVSADTLRAEGLSEAFVNYMRNWKGFVADD
jgi:2,4-dienoyl-CoA reductase-like NADH-dependent reductase (Old Yellow Enzyme family)